MDAATRFRDAREENLCVEEQVAGALAQRRFQSRCRRPRVEEVGRANSAATLFLKWLGYRQADRGDGKPLTEDERRWLCQMSQRIAALLTVDLSPDALYQEAVAASFTAVELGIQD